MKEYEFEVNVLVKGYGNGETKEEAKQDFSRQLRNTRNDNYDLSDFLYIDIKCVENVADNEYNDEDDEYDDEDDEYDDDI